MGLTDRAKVGQALGGKIDDVAPIIEDFERFIPVTRDGMALAPATEVNIPREVSKGVKEILQAKRQNAIRPDGTERGSAETILGY